MDRAGCHQVVPNVGRFDVLERFGYMNLHFVEVREASQSQEVKEPVRGEERATRRLASSTRRPVLEDERDG